jgi:hypothetical protein
LTVKLNDSLAVPSTRAHQGGGGYYAAATPTNQNLKNTGFCRHNIKYFPWFTFQPKLATEIGW